MTGRNISASVLLAGSLAVVLLGIASLADTASAEKAVRKSGESARKHVADLKRRGRVRPPPIAPSYIAYDYPYYYSRGFYPTHIGPGYIYYGRPYLYGRIHRPRYSSRCAKQKCVANWRQSRSSASPSRKTARGD